MPKRTEKWIQGAVTKPGALREYVQREYGEQGFDQHGRIKVSVLRELAEHGPTERTRRRARLALTLRRLSQGRP